MTTRTITITEEAYRLLATKKGAGESFSEVIKRRMGGSSLWDIVGALTPDEAETMRTAIKAGRESLTKSASDAAKRVR